MLQAVSLSDLANGAQIVGAVVVVVSLVFIAAQLRQTTELAKAENVRELTTHTIAFNASLYQDPELLTLWYSFGQNLDAMKPGDRLRYREMLTQWLLLHMNIYYQWQRGLLAPEIYHPWREDLRTTVVHHNLQVLAADIMEFFPGPFGQELIRLKREGAGIP
jgi:hypothetical protein